MTFSLQLLIDSKAQPWCLYNSKEALFLSEETKEERRWLLRLQESCGDGVQSQIENMKIGSFVLSLPQVKPAPSAEVCLPACPTNFASARAHNAPSPSVAKDDVGYSIKNSY